LGFPIRANDAGMRSDRSDVAGLRHATTAVHAFQAQVGNARVRFPEDASGVFEAAERLLAWMDGLSSSGVHGIASRTSKSTASDSAHE
jgi:hypothetical protein